jgi:hypothetical protein
VGRDNSGPVLDRMPAIDRKEKRKFLIAEISVLYGLAAM